MCNVKIGKYKDEHDVEVEHRNGYDKKMDLAIKFFDERSEIDTFEGSQLKLLFKERHAQDKRRTLGYITGTRLCKHKGGIYTLQ